MKPNEIHQEVQRRIDYITRRLQDTNLHSAPAWELERSALQQLLKRSNRVQGLVVALEMVDTAVHKGDTETARRIIAEALGRTT